MDFENEINWSVTTKECHIMGWTFTQGIEEIDKANTLWACQHLYEIENTKTYINMIANPYKEHESLASYF